MADKLLESLKDLKNDCNTNTICDAFDAVRDEIMNLQSEVEKLKIKLEEKENDRT